MIAYRKLIEREAELFAIIKRIRDLHSPSKDFSYCLGCKYNYPCDTILEIDGEK
jgi:hypothetical protein